MSSISYKNSNFIKQYQLISKHYNVLMVDTINGTSKFINYFTNNNTPPTFTPTTFIVPTINTIATTTLTSYNWFVESNITCNTCIVHNNIHTVTGTTITNIDVNKDYVSTKYYIDWMKNYVYMKMVKNIQDAAREDLGHIKSNTADVDFVLFAYNLDIAGGGDSEYNHEFSYIVGGETYTYNMSIDMHSLNRCQTCGFTVANNGGKIENENSSLLTPAIGFRKKYIVKMIPTTLEFN